MNDIAQYIPFLIPVVIIELALMITALVHVLRHPHYRFGTRPVWIVIVVLFQIIGPVIYFAFGRGDE